MSKKGYKLVPWLFGKEIEIPEEWEVKSIKELGEIITGSTPDTNNKEYFDNDYLWASPSDLQKEKYVKQTNSMLSKKGLSISRKIPKDSVLVVCIGSTIGKIGMASMEMSTNQQINSIICNQNDSHFIYYQLLRNNYLIKNIANQVAVPILNKTDFGKLKFSMPAKIVEQQKIASILSNVDSLIDSTSKIIENSKSLKTGLMQKLLTKGIGHTKFKKVPWLFGKEIEIPVEWELDIVNVLTLQNDKGAIRMGPFGSNLKTSELLDSGKIKTLWIENIVNNEFTWKYQKFITEKKYEELKSFTVKPNDILITMMGTLGRVAIVPDNIGTAIISSHLLKISLDQKKANYLFLYYILKSHFVFRQIIKESRGLVMGGLNTGIIKNLHILIPPLPEQQKIATILSNIDAQINSQTQYKEKLERLKKSLMQKLLTGEVRVAI